MADDPEIDPEELSDFLGACEEHWDSQDETDVEAEPEKVCKGNEEEYSQTEGQICRLERIYSTNLKIVSAYD